MRASVVIGLVCVVMSSASTRADTPRPIPAYSVWQGSYVCAQGITSVRLTIETSSKGGAMAKFEFGPHRDNPKVPTGRYWMTGTVQVNPRGALEVALAPDRWAEQPTGYVMVGLHATSDLEQHSLAGRIDFRSCGKISVKRVEAERN
jgi:hypothetical protein